LQGTYIVIKAAGRGRTSLRVEEVKLLAVPENKGSATTVHGVAAGRSDEEDLYSM
jgi:hypothetical protein